MLFKRSSFAPLSIPNMEDDISPKVDSRRGDQAVFHVTPTGNHTDDAVEQKNLYQQCGTQVREGGHPGQKYHRAEMAGGKRQRGDGIGGP